MQVAHIQTIVTKDEREHEYLEGSYIHRLEEASDSHVVFGPRPCSTTVMSQPLVFSIKSRG